MRIAILGWLIVHPVFAGGALGADPSEIAQRAEELIAGIASPNPAPTPGEDARWLHFDDNWNKEAQRKVFDAIRELWDLGPEAFSVLLKHTGDTRYSCTVKGMVVEKNMSVGNVCYRIVKDWIAGSPYYVDRKAPECFGDKGLIDWCQRNKDKEPYQLQISARENAIEYWESEEPERYLSNPEDVRRVREDMARAIKLLRKDIEILQTTKKPIVHRIPFAFVSGPEAGGYRGKR